MALQDQGYRPLLWPINDLEQTTRAEKKTKPGLECDTCALKGMATKLLSQKKKA